MQHVVPYTPRENGVALRKNITLKDMATCMLEAKDLPPKLWADVVNCAAYLQNRVPHKGLKGKKLKLKLHS